jgi:aspartate/glutamate racemase
VTRLAIIHTTALTVASLKALAEEMLPGVDVINFVDDSILPQLRDNGGNIDEVERRWVTYVRFAEEAGADVILNACSSVGELTQRGQAQVSVPVLRIDEAMAEEAVKRGRVMGVAATLSTTLEPTRRLLRAKAEAAGHDVELVPVLADEAFRRLSAGDRAGHDAVLSMTLSQLAEKVEIVVLAQASMARVVEGFPESLRGRFLSSPRSGMERVRTILAGKS